MNLVIRGRKKQINLVAAKDLLYVTADPEPCNCARLSKTCDRSLSSSFWSLGFAYKTLRQGTNFNCSSSDWRECTYPAMKPRSMKPIFAEGKVRKKSSAKMRWWSCSAWECFAAPWKSFGSACLDMTYFYVLSSSSKLWGHFWMQLLFCFPTLKCCPFLNSTLFSLFLIQKYSKYVFLFSISWNSTGQWWHFPSSWWLPSPPAGWSPKSWDSTNLFPWGRGSKRS